MHFINALNRIGKIIKIVERPKSQIYIIASTESCLFTSQSETLKLCQSIKIKFTQQQHFTKKSEGQTKLQKLNFGQKQNNRFSNQPQKKKTKPPK